MAQMYAPKIFLQKNLHCCSKRFYICSRKQRRKFRRKITDMGAIMENITLAELAEQSGGNYDTLYRKAKRTFPGETWSKDSALSAEHIAALSGKKIKSPKREKPAATPRPAPLPVDKSKPAKRREYGLVALMLTATAASVQNMYRVTAELSEANMSAVLLTVVLSASDRKSVV